MKQATEVDSAAPKGVDVPLTPAEVTEMKAHFRLLREYKKPLKLKLNAQEDLLLNGSKEPSSRGVCHHLLSKVDYAQVAAASARLDPADRARLVAGVLRFKTDLAFLLLYLESLKDSAHDEATKALQSALERIDFSTVSEGQMRRLLDLMVELFNESQRPALLFSLLHSRSFRQAFDSSLSKLPDGLVEYLTPLRAVHAVVFAQRPNPVDDEALRQGLELMLKTGLPGLLRRPERVKARFLEQLREHAPDCLATSAKALGRVVDSFTDNQALLVEWHVWMARRWLSEGNDQKARSHLRKLLERFPEQRLARRLLELLDAPRFGSLATQLPSGELPSVGELTAAIDLSDLAPVWVRLGKPDELSSIEAHEQLVRGVLVPGVARPETRQQDEHSVRSVVLRDGELLRAGSACLKERRLALSVARQVVSIAAGLVAQGFSLSDLALDRFEWNERIECVRLVNSWKLERTESSEASSAPLLAALARHLGHYPALRSARPALERLCGAPSNGEPPLSPFANLYDELTQMMRTRGEPNPSLEFPGQAGPAPTSSRRRRRRRTSRAPQDATPQEPALCP